MKIQVAFMVITLASLAMPNSADAWGPEGHAIIADIAEVRLNPKAAAEVSRLLATENERHLDEVSSWPDAWRTSHEETTPAHYVDIPLAAARYDEARDCHFDYSGRPVEEPTCIVAKLPYWVGILHDKTRSDAERLAALKWVVHLVGDIHQPLHTEDNGDKGGNKLSLEYFGKASNFHKIWDEGIIEAKYSWRLGPEYTFDHAAAQRAAISLNQQITHEEAISWASSGLNRELEKTVAEWANESHQLAQSAYRRKPSVLRSGWDADYQTFAWPVVRTQLTVSGVRLAEVLNEALR